MILILIKCQFLIIVWNLNFIIARLIYHQVLNFLLFVLLLCILKIQHTNKINKKTKIETFSNSVLVKQFEIIVISNSIKHYSLIILFFFNIY